MFVIWNVDKARLEGAPQPWALACAIADALEARGFLCVVRPHG
jgi:hypothetical protein